jgi:hypothetical protein
MRRLVPVFALLLPWLLFEPVLHDMRFEKGIISILAGLVCLFIAPLAIGIPSVRPVLSATGLLLALSNFFFPDNAATMTSHVLVGLVLMVAGATRAPATTYSDVGEPVSSGADALMHHQPHPGHA